VDTSDVTVSGVGVLDKAVAILDALAASGSLALTELVHVTGLPRPTAHRLAVALEAHGLVGRTDGTRFALGPRLAVLAQLAGDGLDLVPLAASVLAQLRDETGESVQLYVREGDRRRCVAALESASELRTIVDVGALLPLDLGSGGRALTAPGRRSGWVESVGEREAGVASVSAPVRDRRGSVVAAVSVSGPVQRTGQSPGRRYGRLVVAAALRIESALAER
jgi:DNA-binding IclR family transcriptional regulator